MHHLFFALYVTVTAYVFARLEIEIEGADGWAAKLPTWRIHNQWTKIFYGDRPLTGYHLWMQIFVLMMVHWPISMGVWPWSWAIELRSIAFLILFFIIEDFLWFILNPAYGLKRFRPEHVWWHAPTWWWIMPRDYWLFLVIGMGAYVLGCSIH